MSFSLHRPRPPRRSNAALDEPLTSEERAGMIAAATRKFEHLIVTGPITVRSTCATLERAT